MTTSKSRNQLLQPSFLALVRNLQVFPRCQSQRQRKKTQLHLFLHRRQRWTTSSRTKWVAMKSKAAWLVELNPLSPTRDSCLLLSCKRTSTWRLSLLEEGELSPRSNQQLSLGKTCKNKRVSLLLHLHQSSRNSPMMTRMMMSLSLS